MLEHEYYFIGDPRLIRKLGFRTNHYSTSTNYEAAVSSKILKDKSGVKQLVLGYLQIDKNTNQIYILNYSLKATEKEFLALVKVKLDYLIDKNLAKKVEVKK